MRATPRAAIKTPLVGVIMLVKPSPNWKATTVAWREMPIRSLKGAMIGMVMAALAEPLGITILIKVWMPYMISAEAILPMLLIDLERP